MGNCFKKESDGTIRVEEWNESNERKIAKLQKEISTLHKQNKEEEKRIQKEFRELQQRVNEESAILNADWTNYRSAPKRRMRLKKTASKRKSVKTRSQYAKKKKVSRKNRKY